MSYWGLNAIFLGVVAVVAMIARPNIRKLAIPLLILLISTAIFDNLMIGAGLVGYDHHRISGAYIGIAPLEDFAYPLAAVIGLPALWMMLGRRTGKKT